MFIDLANLKLTELNGRCVIDVTKLVQHARSSDQLDLKLTDPDVLCKAYQFGLKSKDLGTRMKFLRLRRSLKSYLENRDDLKISLPKY